MRAEPAGTSAMPPPSAAMAHRGVGFRHARAADMEWLRDLYCAARAEEFALLPWTNALKRILLNDQFRLQHAHYTRTHPHADRLIVTRERVSGGRMDIGRLYIDRSLRPWRLIDITLDAPFRKGGIGRLLMRWLQEAASAAGVGALDLHVAQDNSGARRFYERLGFQQIASLSTTHLRMVLDCPPEPCPEAVDCISADSACKPK